MLWVLIRGLGEALLMSTHNICFRPEIRKILCGYPLLSVAIVMIRTAHLKGNANEYPLAQHKYLGILL